MSALSAVGRTGLSLEPGGMLGKHTGPETNVPSKAERGWKLLFMSLWGSEGGGPQGAEKEQEWRGG